MPRGKYVNHKGRSRHFTSPEELQHQDEESSEAETSSDEEEVEGAAASSSTKVKSKPKVRAKKTTVSNNSDDSDEESSEESSEDDRDARKGVASLIEIENPNRAVKKSTQKLKNLSIEEGPPAEPELTRREREQIEKQKARLRYNKLHAAGKTSEAKADLARLALIRQQRADAAAKREAEKKVSEDKKPTKP